MVAGIKIVLEPAMALHVVGFVFGGVLLGTISGLTPGLHANNFALLLASVAPSIPGPPTLVGAAMLAAGVVHTFLDIVPALAIGVPDAAMAITALPGHRLVIGGRGREALRLSALGSGLAVLFAVPLAIPITAIMTRLYPLLQPRMTIILAAVTTYLIATEGTTRGRVGAGGAFLASATLGFLTLDLEPAAPLEAGGMLAPLFAGLFGAPVLVDAIGGEGIPPQADPGVALQPRTVGGVALSGAVAGAAVGYLPGVSSAIAAVIVLAALPAGADAREFVIATSGVNTANLIFAIFALVALGTPRTGVLVAINEANVPLNLPLMLVVVLCAGAVGFVLVILLGDRYLRVIGRLDYTMLSVTVLAGLVVVSYLFGGFPGIGAFLAAGAIGMVPPRMGARRVHCMGVLIGPLIVR